MEQRIIPIFLAILVAVLILIPAVQAEDALDWYMNGENAVIVGKYAESITYYNNAIALDQKYAAAFSGKAYALYKMGNYSGAIDAADRALAIKNDGRALAVWADALLKLGRYDEAVTAYDKLFVQETNIAEAYCNQGIAYMYLNRTDQALLAFDSCVRLDAGNVLKPRDALDAFNRCTRISADNAEVWNNKGLALLQLGKYQDALECFNKALGIDPGYAAAKQNKELAMNKGQVYGTTGTPQQTTQPPTAVPSGITPVITATEVIPAQPATTATITPEQPEAVAAAKTTYTPLPAWGAIAGILGAGIITLALRRQ